jgi:hypothetical protein
MAGKLIVDTLQTESPFLQLNVSTTRIATMNASGIYSNTGTKMIGYDGTIGAATVNGSALIDNTVTAAKIVSVANTQITGLITTSQLANNLTVNASSIISSANIDFKVGASQNTAFRIEDTGQLYNSIESTEGTDYRGALYAGYMCRAWVNFDGTGTPAIRASGNVTSITDNGTGDYTVNFTTAMPDANYCVDAAVSCRTSPAGTLIIQISSSGATTAPVTPTTSAVRLAVFERSTGNSTDAEYVSSAIFR